MPNRHRATFLGSAVTVLAALGAAGCGGAASTPKSATPAKPAQGTVTTIPPAPPRGPIPRPVTSTEGWPGALHDAAHSGTSAGIGPQSSALRWTRNLGGPISGGAAVGPDGTIYAFGNTGVLHALDPATGADKWTFDGGGTANNDQDLSTTPAVLADGTVLWPGPRSTLFALNPSGHLKWTLQLRGTVLSPAVTATGKVYVADSAGDLDAITPGATTAEVRWRLSIGPTSFGSPAVAADGVIYGTAGPDLVAVKDAGSHAEILWRYTARADIEVSASVAPDGTIILGTNDAYEYGISPEGTVRWRYPRKVFSYSTPAATPDGLAYFGDNDGYVDVVHATTGTVVGRYNGRSKPLSAAGVGVWTAPLIDSHHDVYFGTAAGHIIGYSYIGTELFNLATGATVDSYPALTANGTLIIGSDNGNLYAIG
jgi:outer membrane protein assembly factor BamB